MFQARMAQYSSQPANGPSFEGYLTGLFRWQLAWLSVTVLQPSGPKELLSSGPLGWVCHWPTFVFKLSLLVFAGVIPVRSNFHRSKQRIDLHHIPVVKVPQTREQSALAVNHIPIFDLGLAMTMTRCVGYSRTWQGKRVIFKIVRFRILSSKCEDTVTA